MPGVPRKFYSQGTGCSNLPREAGERHLSLLVDIIPGAPRLFRMAGSPCQSSFWAFQADTQLLTKWLNQ